MGSLMGMEYRHGLTRGDMQENGTRANTTETASSAGQMVANMLANFRMTRNMATVFTLGQAARSTSECGSSVSNTAME